MTPFKSAKGSAIPSPSDGKSGPGTHHHHAPVAKAHYHHHVAASRPAPQVNPIIPIPIRRIDSRKILESVADRQRLHLGFQEYQAKLEPKGEESRNRGSNTGFASTPLPLPRLEGKENCTLTIKIPRIHISDISREEITRRKAVWGTDIYTDDSDVIAACIHEGWFRGAWAPGVDTSLLDLEIGEPPAGPIDIGQVLTKPPPSGPWKVPKKHDAHVNILILPKLVEYKGCVRFGIKSREWGVKRNGYKGSHDGLSFKIMSVQWIAGAGVRGSRKKAIFNQQLTDEELQEEERLAKLLANGNGRPDREMGDIEESFERGGGNSWSEGMKGVGSKSWNKPVAKVIPTPLKEAAAVKEAEKAPALVISPPRVPLPPPIPSPIEPPAVLELERLQQQGRFATVEKDVVEMVTERMIENANATPVQTPISDLGAVAVLLDAAARASEAAQGQAVHSTGFNGDHQAPPVV